MHSELNHLVAEGDYPEISKILFNDLWDLSSALPVDLPKDGQYMRATLSKPRKKWLTIIDKEEQGTPYAWLTTPTLIQEHKDGKTDSRKAAARAKHEEDVARDTAVRIAQLD